MQTKSHWPVAAAAGLSVAFAFGPTLAETPKRGGTLNFVVGSKIPSYDGHRESTFGMIHPIRPFYSLLLRINPDNPQSTTDFVCDACEGAVPKATNDGKRYTFKIRKDVFFHDGQQLTSADVKATFEKIIFPPKGAASPRKAFFTSVEKVTAPDKWTVVFDLKYPTTAFIPSAAMPFNFLFSKAKLDKDIHWYEKNIMGSGPFIFVQHQPGAFVEGKANPKFYHKGADGKPMPYLNGYKAISAPKMAVRLQAIRGDREAIEFRGFPPKARDDLVKALGNRIRVQESDWNCNLMFSTNHARKPFTDARVRRAMTLAVDRWGGSKYLSQIAIVRAVGGIVFPKHPLAATKKELHQLAGYWPDIKKSRAAARKLLKDAGVKKGHKFIFNNRAVDQPYKVVGTWLLDQWKQIGLAGKQEVKPTGPFFASLRKKKDWDASIDFNCQAIVNPLADLSKFQSDDIAGNNYGVYKDRQVDKWYDQIARETDLAKQRALVRKYEKRILEEEAHIGVTLWWYKINPHRSYVKGWKIAPSHYLNQSLEQVWLDK
jgi:peptide/nickel transport system substrate-binding protein